jgi:hypothetical protein
MLIVSYGVVGLETVARLGTFNADPSGKQSIVQTSRLAFGLCIVRTKLLVPSASILVLYPDVLELRCLRLTCRPPFDSFQRQCSRDPPAILSSAHP